MQNEAIHTFENTLFGSLNVFVGEHGTLWFVGRQVAEKLGYGADSRQNLSKAIARHCADRKNVSEMSTISVDVLPQSIRRNSVLISEADLYRLVMNSTLPSAVAFQDWVVREVLPSIREHGGYVIEQPTMAEQRANPEIMEEVNLRFQDFREEMGAMIREVVPAAVSAAVTGLVPAVVAAFRQTSVPIPARAMPQGFMTLEDLYALTNGRISKEAFKSLLRSANWTRSTYDKVLEDGRVVELTCWAENCLFHGEVIHINQLVDRVIREARNISTYYYEHRLITGRFRINN